MNPVHARRGYATATIRARPAASAKESPAARVPRAYHGQEVECLGAVQGPLDCYLAKAGEPEPRNRPALEGIARRRRKGVVEARIMLFHMERQRQIVGRRHKRTKEIAIGKIKRAAQHAHANAGAHQAGEMDVPVDPAAGQARQEQQGQHPAYTPKCDHQP